MIETIVLALVVAKLKGYRLKTLFKSWHIYPIMSFALIYIFLQIAVFMGNYSFVKYGSLLEKLYVISFIFLIFKYKQYAGAVLGSVLVFTGTCLNRIVISANGGKMPVFPTLSYLTGYVKHDTFARVNDIHILGNAATKFKFLTDVIDLGYSVMSIGDVFIRLFAFVIILGAIRSVNLKEMKTNESN